METVGLDESYQIEPVNCLLISFFLCLCGCYDSKKILSIGRNELFCLKDMKLVLVEGEAIMFLTQRGKLPEKKMQVS